MNKQPDRDDFVDHACYFMETIVSRCLEAVDQRLPSKEKLEIAQTFAASVVEAEDKNILPLLCHKGRSSFERLIMDRIIDLMDDQRFEQFLSDLSRQREDLVFNENGSTSAAVRIENALSTLMNSSKGRLRSAKQKKEEIDQKVQEIRKYARLHTDLDKLLKGEISYKSKQTLVTSLPDAVTQMLMENKAKTAIAIIKKASEGLLSEDPALRSDTINAVVEISEMLINAEYTDIMATLSPQLIRWLKAKKTVSPEVKKIVFQLKELVIFLIKEQRFNDTNHILETFFTLMTRRRNGYEELRDLADQTVREISDSGVVEILIDEFQTDRNGKRKQVANLLPKFGAYATEPLLVMLKDSPSRTERARILQAVTDIGPYAANELTSQLQEAEEWFYIRNIILLLGEVGDGAHVNHVIPFLKYNDIRVRREAVKTVSLIGGNKKESILISMLSDSDQRLFPDIVEALGSMKSTKAVPYLLKLLTPDPDSEMDESAGKIIDILGRIQSSEALAVLRDIIERRGAFASSPLNETLVRKALQAIDKIGEADDTIQSIPTQRIPLEKHETEPGDQTNAELKVESLPGVDEEHRKRWAELYDTLTEDEAKVFFHTLKEGVCTQGKLIYKQGKKNSGVYFIETGELVLAYDQGEVIRPFGKTDVDGWNDEEVWIKNLSPGDIAGYESFLLDSVFTTSMRTLSDVKLRILSKADFDAVCGYFPGIERKVRAFCESRESINDILQQYGMERRIDHRFPISGTVSLQFFDNNDTPKAGPFTAKANDISTGGVACITTIGQSLLPVVTQLRVRVKFNLVFDNETIRVEQFGSVVSVYKGNAQKEFRLHLKFDEIPVELLEVFPVTGNARLEDPNQSGGDDIFLRTVIPT